MMHTPGPWKASRAADGSYPITAMIRGVETRIAEVYPADWPDTPDNANVIAAAPMLLEACKAFFSLGKYQEGCCGKCGREAPTVRLTNDEFYENVWGGLCELCVAEIGEAAIEAATKTD